MYIIRTMLAESDKNQIFLNFGILWNPLIMHHHK